ncbi:MAG TPA: molybdate ABC transporter substrate-binding protein [Tepidisphaeraceae bacterium]|nr:molybdate ABC transporter substrate-binding protein [Tepidisphaeraceae bacterium]
MRIAVLSFLAIACCARVAPAAETIDVAAAVSLREALTDASRTFELTGIHVALTLGSSGQLAAQITNGAPVDAFISAAKQQVDQLSKAGLVDDSTRQIMAGNELVLIVSPNARQTPPQNFQQLAEARFNKVAIGEPRTVPAGQYAMQTLTALQIEQALRPRLIFGANVRQVLDYVERGEVAAGVVYATDAQEAGAKVRVVATADPSTHEPIVYPAVLLKNAAHRDAAMRFLDFLVSDQGQAALRAHGFTHGSAPSKP